MPLRHSVSLRRHNLCLVTCSLLFFTYLLTTAALAQVKLLATPHAITGTGPIGVASGDLNGDGKADLVVVNDRENSISVLISNGDGTFHAAVNYPVGTNPENAVIGDFNGDGKPDLAVSIGGVKEVAVLLGNGDGTFQSAVNYSTSDYLIAIATGDFNGDGKLDVAVSDINGGVDILLGNGDGTFGSAHTFTTPATPVGLVVGDFNGNGKLDIAIITDGSSNSTVNIYLGNGDGTFSAGASYTFAKNLMQVSAADLNGDSKLDLVVTDSGISSGATASIFVMLGNGAGTFATPVNYAALPSPVGLAVADVNGDGKPDLATTDVVNNIVHIWLGNGDGTFQNSVEYAAGLTPKAVAAGDFNGDGKVDLVSANSGSNDASILVGNGDGTFLGARVFDLGNISNPTPLGTLLTPTVVLGDFNNDHKLDMALGTPGGLLALGNGDGTLQTPTSLAAAQGQVVGPLLAADLNNDGNLDLVAGAALNLSLQTGVAAVLLGDGHGTFAEQNVSLTNKSPSGIAAADFNSDGHPDLIAIDSGYGTNTLLGDGTGNFQVVSPDGIGNSFNAVVTADFNGDGKPDAMVYGIGSLVIGLGNGDGTFNQTTLPYTFSNGSASSSTTIATADFNGDGIPDVVVANNGGVSVLLGNGDGTFQTPVDYAAGASPQSIAIADLDQDGHPDLVVGGSGTLAVLPGNADGTFQPAVIFSAPGQNVSVTVGDLNGDGLPDVLVADNISTTQNTYGTAVVFLNQTGILLTGTTTALSSSSNPAVTGQSVTVTATVTPASGSSLPTGTVMFLDGSTTLGTVALSGGTATFTSSTFSVGSHNLSASYSGDSHFSVSTSAVLAQVINATPFTLAAMGSTTTSITAGSPATYQLMLTPGTVSSQSVTLTCNGAPQASTCSVSPNPAMLSGTSPTNVTVTVQTTGSMAAMSEPPLPGKTKGSRQGLWGAMGMLFAGMLLVSGVRKPRRWGLGLLLGLLIFLAACGGSGSGGGGQHGTPAGTYTLNVTATSTAGTQSIQLKLTVN